MRRSYSYVSGLLAELRVIKFLIRKNLQLVSWRQIVNRVGEIDCVFDDKFGGLIFVEVKKVSRHRFSYPPVTFSKMKRFMDTASMLWHLKYQNHFDWFRLDVALIDKLGTIDMIKNVSQMM